MTAVKRLYAFISILIFVAVIIVSVAMTLLYDSAFEQQRVRLIDTVKSQASLARAVARYDQETTKRFRVTDPSFDETEATLGQLRDAHAEYDGIGQTGEFTLARLEGDQIVFLLNHRHHDKDDPPPVSFASAEAEPMRRALSGESGSMVGPDYEGTIVLAAYEPLRELSIGIVAKIDVSEIRAPFIRVGLITIAITMVFIILGSLLVFRVGNPLVSELKEKQSQLRDILERKQTEEALKKSETHFSTLVEIIPDLVWLKDPDGLYLSCNHRFEQFFGAKRENIVGKTDYDFVNKEEADLFRDNDRLATETGKPSMNEEMLTFADDGHKEYVETIRTPMLDSDGSLIGVLGIAHDITERKRAEEALEERRVFQEAVLECIEDGIVACDSEGTLTYFNRATREFHGLPSEPIPPEKWASHYDLYEPDGKTPLACERIPLFRALKGEEVSNQEIVIVAKGVPARTLIATGHKLLDSKGNQLGAMVSMNDITERKIFDETLQENEEKFRTLFEASSDAVVLLDEGGFSECNDATLEVFGCLSKDEFCGTHPSELSPQQQPCGTDSMALANEHIATAMEYRTHSYEWIHQKTDGTQFPCEVLLNAMELKGKILIQAVVRDITKRKENEVMLLQREKEQRDILNAIHAGIIIIDPETRKIVSCNPAALDMIGTTEDQVIGNACHSFICPSQTNSCDLLDDNRTIVRVEKELITVDGTKLPILITVSRIKLNGKEHLLETFIDLSEQKKAELERLGLELEMNQSRKLEAVGSLAAGIAHEINTPIQFVGDNTNFMSDSFKSLMSLIKAYEGLWQKANSGADIAELDHERVTAEEEADIVYLKAEIPSAIEQTLDGVKRVSKIVRAMKDFAHSDQGVKSTNDLNAMLESTLTVARNELKYVADVTTNFDQGLPDIDCYRDELNQVFLNLLINASHAILGVVGDESAQKGLITVSTQLDNNDVVVRISDTGTGIPKSVRERIFDPFFSTKEVGKGTGQGLAIARRIVVDKHVGSLDFETEEGKGTTFIIRLPITVPETVEV